MVPGADFLVEWAKLRDIVSEFRNVNMRAGKAIVPINE